MGNQLKLSPYQCRDSELRLLTKEQSEEWLKRNPPFDFKFENMDTFQMNDRDQVFEDRHKFDPTRQQEIDPREMLTNRAELLMFFVERLKEVGFEENAATMLAAYQFNL